MLGHDRWWIPIDIRDIQQERALAVLEHRCPDRAAKDWFRRERLWYRFHLSFPEDHGDPDVVDAWIAKFCAAMSQSLAVNRSAESMEQRKEQVREWWRKNGREYRCRRRQDSRSARRPIGPRSGAHA